MGNQCCETLTNKRTQITVIQIKKKGGMINVTNQQQPKQRLIQSPERPQILQVQKIISPLKSTIEKQQKQEEKSIEQIRKSIHEEQKQQQLIEIPPPSFRKSDKTIIVKPTDTIGIQVEVPALNNKIIENIQRLGPFKKDLPFLQPPIRKPHQFIENNHIYEGQWLNKKPHGYGKLYLPNGALFQGQFIQGMANGKGRMYYPNGDCYEGDIKFNQASGKGRFYSKNLQYEGDFFENLFHGNGIQKCQDGSYFTGEYKNGLKYDGVLKWNNNEYVGFLNQEGLFHGRGKLITPDSLYQGDFMNGLKHGYGQYKRKGTVYKGQYQFGVKCGQGTFYNANGSIAYKGNWKNNMPNGQGSIYVRGEARPVREWIDGISKQQLELVQQKSPIISEKK